MKVWTQAKKIKLQTDKSIYLKASPASVCLETKMVKFQIKRTLFYQILCVS